MELTIVTVCYNNLQGLERTFASIKTEIDIFEWIIVDGGSNDGTNTFLQNLDYSNIRWISEKDLGIFDAMNKGIVSSTGNYLLFLNAGDTLNLKIIELLNLIPQFKDVNVFGIQKIDTYGTIVKWNGLHTNAAVLEKFPGIPHQSTVIKKSVIDKIGLYDLSYKLMADYDFFCKAFLRSVEFKYFSQLTLSYFYLDGVSSKYLNSLKCLKEFDAIHQAHFKTRIDFYYRIQYYYKYILGFLPFSDYIMKVSRRLIFKKY